MVRGAARPPRAPRPPRAGARVVNAGNHFTYGRRGRYDHGNNLLSAGEVAAAEAPLRHAIALFPDYIFARYTMYLALDKQGVRGRGGWCVCVCMS